MSGGSFNQAWIRAGHFAEGLKELLDHPTEEEIFHHETIAKLREIENKVLQAGKLMREVEYLYSGDTGNETFLERVAEIEKEWSAQ